MSLSVRRFAFSIVARIKADGTFERLADNLFAVAARKRDAILTESGAAQ
jgi:hypothetical protein